MAEVVDNDEKIGVCENDFVISTPKVTMFSIWFAFFLIVLFVVVLSFLVVTDSSEFSSSKSYTVYSCQTLFFMYI